MTPIENPFVQAIVLQLLQNDKDALEKIITEEANQPNKDAMKDWPPERQEAYAQAFFRGRLAPLVTRAYRIAAAISDVLRDCEIIDENLRAFKTANLQELAAFLELQPDRTDGPVAAQRIHYHLHQMPGSPPVASVSGYYAWYFAVAPENRVDRGGYSEEERNRIDTAVLDALADHGEGVTATHRKVQLKVELLR